MTKALRKCMIIFAILTALLCTLTLSACGMSETDQDLYREVLALALEEAGEDDWVFTGQCSGWSMEISNPYDEYNFYINKAQYNTYKNYWLEDVPKEEYYANLNFGLGTYGDYAQHCINIYQLNYIEDTTYKGVPLEKNKNYYLVTVYDRAVYYRYVSSYSDSSGYMVFPSFNVDEDSISMQMLYHKDRKKWVMHKLDSNS